MPTMQQISRALIAVTSLALMLPAPSQAQVDSDTQEINSYVLTDAGLAHYIKAIEALKPLTQKKASECADDEDDSNPQSIDQLAAKVDATPGAKAALQSTGTTAREYVVFSMSLFQTGLASWGLQQPGGKLPPGVSMANVDFYRKNEAALVKLGEATQSDDCGEQEVEDDDGE
jgi:hypothetical protein